MIDILPSSIIYNLLTTVAILYYRVNSIMKVKYVTTQATQSSQFELFDISFPQKLLKIVATRLLEARFLA